MRIQHLNCGTMRPFGGRFVDVAARGLGPTRWVCHCLLVETERGLVLVDTGLGSVDVAAGAGRLGRPFVAATRPDLAREETAAAQVARLGHRVEDVRHIVLTHLDLDHAGGLPDFPNATVHVHATEHAAAMSPTGGEKARYRPQHWAHGPNWATHAAVGEPWFGFEAVRDLPGLPPEILLVPLHGHSRGHTGVAVRKSGGGWLLHAGDAYFSHRRIDPVRPGSPPLARAFENVVQLRGPARRSNQQRLRELVRDHSAEVDVLCSHDSAQFDRLSGAVHGGTSDGGTSDRGALGGGSLHG